MMAAISNEGLSVTDAVTVLWDGLTFQPEPSTQARRALKNAEQSVPCRTGQQNIGLMLTQCSIAVSYRRGAEPQFLFTLKRKQTVYRRGQRT
jgi:hypothetical protein